MVMTLNVLFSISDGRKFKLNKTKSADFLNKVYDWILFDYLINSDNL